MHSAHDSQFRPLPVLGRLADLDFSRQTTGRDATCPHKQSLATQYPTKRPTRWTLWAVKMIHPKRARVSKTDHWLRSKR